ncbi:hypothetical protein ACFWOT_18025 [Streptomyces sp. NPDC058440]|uniref:hypothetical protein n=1 Tax=Streptomyces sp. NPDC058440 TaxID=3346501 RepID=UPI0036555603
MRPEDPRRRGRGDPHLAEEFEKRLAALQAAGEVVDPRAAQTERLKAEVAQLKERLAARDVAVAALEAFRVQAVSRIAAQHDEIARLRKEPAATNVRQLTGRAGTLGSGS